jgi:hypothetical protein
MIMMCLSCAVLAAWLACVPRRRGSFGTGSPPQRLPSPDATHGEGSDAGDDYGPISRHDHFARCDHRIGPSRQRKGAVVASAICWLG